MDTKTKVLCYIIISFLIMRYVYFVAVTGYKGLSGDFIVYNKNVCDIAEFKKDSSEEEIYKLLTKDTFVAYFPLFYLSLVPLFKMGYSTASVIWLLFNQAALLVSLFLLIKTIKPRLSLVEFAIVVFMTANFLPIVHNIIGGQTSFLVLLSLSGCLYFLEQRKEFFAGIFLALAVLLKLSPVLFLVFLIWKKKYRCVLSCILFLVLMYLISILCLGFKFHYIQLFKVIPDAVRARKGTIVNHSLFAIFQRLFRFDVGYTKGILHLPFLADFLSCFSALVFLFLTLRKLFIIGRETTNNFSFEFAFFLCLVYLISPFMLIYHLVWALIPFLIAFLNIEKIKHWIWIFILSFLLLGLEYWPDGLAVFRQGWGVIFLSGRAIGMVLLWIGYFFILSSKKTNAKLA